MAHKIVLTGTPASELRSVGEIFNFDMTQTTPNVAKGLPMPENPIVYTVFINKKQKSKLSVSPKDFVSLNLCVQGEPTLDVPVDQCPGEIGVLCNQIERIPNKNNQENPNVAEAEKDVQLAEKEVAVTLASETNEFNIHHIVIPEAFQKSPPNPAKIAEKKDLILKAGKIEKQIRLSKKKVLQDGYAWYMAAMELGFSEVPVTFK